MDTGSQEEEKKLRDVNDTLHQGVEYIKEGDREVRFRSLEDLIRIRNIITNKLSLRRAKQLIFPRFRKGL